MPLSHPARSTAKKENVSDWVGKKKRNISATSKEGSSWKNVHENIKQMDQIYDATFYTWLKSEENVLVTSIYLHRIANEYSLERIINVIQWLTKDWRWESTSILVRHVMVDWCDSRGDIKRAKLLRELTRSWATQFTATLITSILVAAPYAVSLASKRERFLTEFTKNWDFSKLSEFFMFLRSKANIDYKFKCFMLQKAARKDMFLPSNTSTTAHHRRTSSHDLEEVKRSFLEEKIKKEAMPSNELLDARDNTSDIALFNNEASTSGYSSSDHFTNPSNNQPESASNLHRYHHHTSLMAKKQHAKLHSVSH